MTFSIDKANHTQRPQIPSELGGLKLFGYHGRKDYLYKHFNQAGQYHDNSLQTTTLRKERLAKSIERMKMKAHRIEQLQISNMRKQELINLYSG